MTTVEEAVRLLRQDPRQAQLVEDGYLDQDVCSAARRFGESQEFAEVKRHLGPHLAGAVILDLGAGSGFASHALGGAGARVVYALEPDASDDIGYGGMGRLGTSATVRPIAGVGESIPLQTGSVDIVYARQVLHHVRDLDSVLRECARVLRRRGVLFATREHVAETQDDLHTFLEQHPIHRIAGGENAFPLKTYVMALERAGFRGIRVLRPWESIINAFPGIRTKQDLRAQPRLAADLFLRSSPAWRSLVWLRHVPWFERLLWIRLRRPGPGALYSFLAVRG